MGRGVIEVPFDEVVTLVKDIQNNHIWDKFIVVSLCRWSNSMWFVSTCTQGLCTLSSFWNLPQEAKYLKVLSQSQTHTDYIGTYMCVISDVVYTVNLSLKVYCIMHDNREMERLLSFFSRLKSCVWIPATPLWFTFSLRLRVYILFWFTWPAKP